MYDVQVPAAYDAGFKGKGVKVCPEPPLPPRQRLMLSRIRNRSWPAGRTPIFGDSVDILPWSAASAR